MNAWLLVSRFISWQHVAAAIVLRAAAILRHLRVRSGSIRFFDLLELGLRLGQFRLKNPDLPLQIGVGAAACRHEQRGDCKDDRIRPAHDWRIAAPRGRSKPPWPGGDLIVAVHRVRVDRCRRRIPEDGQALKIAFVGNCQAHSLWFIYDRYFGSRLGQATVFVDGWKRDSLAESNRALAEADIVIAQLFTGPMGAELDRPRAGAKVIRFPDVRGSFLWPYGNEPRPDNPVTPFMTSGPYDPEVGDRFLNRMIRDGVAPEEALDRYLAHDVVRETNLSRLFEIMVDQQRVRDAATGMTTADFILERLQCERLFRTQGHLEKTLFDHLARQVYARMDIALDEIDAALARELHHPFTPFHDAPIHPAVTAYFRLNYLGSKPRFYHLHEGRFTFEEYVLRYMRNQWCPDLHQACARLDHPDHEQTLALFDRAFQLVTDCGHGYEKKAHLLWTLGRFHEAVEAMEHALAREPGYGYYEAVLEHHRRWAENG